MANIQRIAILSVHTCPLAVLGGKKTGGMNVYVRELARELGRRGIRVDVFTRSQNPCIPHINDMLGENARVIHVPAGPEAPLDPDQVYPHLPEFTENVLRFAESEGIQYDIIYSHYWLSGVAAHTLRALWGIPVVQMFHTLGVMKERIANPGTADLRPADLRSFNEADIMSWADRSIAATPAERAQMLWLYRAPRRKIAVIPPGVNLSRFKPMSAVAAKAALGLASERNLLLFVGRIEPLKGVDTIFEALAILKRQAPHMVRNLSLMVIGGDPDEPIGSNTEMDRLKALRLSLGLDDLVVFLGAKDQDTLNYYYAASEALIMPSDYESFGMVALEAMASGTPVIASEVGGLAHLVRDGQNGYHIPTRDPQALADKICLLLCHPQVQDKMRQVASRNAADHAWPLIADRLLAVFDEVTAARHAAAS